MILRNDSRSLGAFFTENIEEFSNVNYLQYSDFIMHEKSFAFTSEFFQVVLQDCMAVFK